MWPASRTAAGFRHRRFQYGNFASCLTLRDFITSVPPVHERSAGACEAATAAGSLWYLPEDRQHSEARLRPDPAEMSTVLCASSAMAPSRQKRWRTALAPRRCLFELTPLVVRAAFFCLPRRSRGGLRSQNRVHAVHAIAWSVAQNCRSMPHVIYHPHLLDGVRESCRESLPDAQHSSSVSVLPNSNETTNAQGRSQP